MKKQIFIALIVLVIICCSFTFAQEEDWYCHFYAGIGLSVSYPGFVQDEIDWVEANEGSIDPISAEYELGFYWPLNGGNKNILGFTLISGFVTLYSSGSDSLSAMTSLGVFALSYQQYFGDEIGVGPFYRVDLGLLGSSISFTNDFNSTDDMKIGMGYLIGGGYGWLPDGWDTRVVLQGHYLGVSAGGSSGALSMGVAWLF